MKFAESEKINITRHIEKKGRFNYLSWPFAVSELRKNYPAAYWVVEQYGDNKQPYCVSDSGCFVSVTVFLGDVPYTQFHPVLDNKNNTIATPNAYQVNTSIQRCLVKAIALATGIGLHIYAGEDLPPGDGPKDTMPSKPAAAQKLSVADYMAKFDKFKTVAEANAWADKYWHKVQADLGAEGNSKASAYFDQIIAVIAGKEVER